MAKIDSSLPEVKRQHFYSSGRVPAPKSDDFTYRLVAEDNSDGSVSVKKVAIELLLQPLSALKFTDFSLGQLIKNGIKPKHLMIQTDERFGDLSADIDNFNSYLEENASKLFNN